MSRWSAVNVIYFLGVVCAFLSLLRTVADRDRVDLLHASPSTAGRKVLQPEETVPSVTLAGAALVVAYGVLVFVLRRGA